MKKLIFASLIIALMACTSKDDPKAFQIKSTDMISFSPAIGAFNAPQKAKGTESHLSALEIVRQASVIQYKHNGLTWERAFGAEYRDTISSPPRLLTWATDVITIDGSLQPEFLEATDVLFIKRDNVTLKRDTIAFLTNQGLRIAETAIRAAYDDKDIEACYNLFNTAYAFVPITGDEWRELKLHGLN